MKCSAAVLVGLVFCGAPVLADLTFYGVRFPSAGPRTSGVIRTSLPDFPWLSARKVRTLEDLERLTNPGDVETGGEDSSAKPAIFYISKQKATTGKANLNQSDAHYFLQEDVAKRVDEYRWYWTDLSSTAGRLLVGKYDLPSSPALLIFEADGSLLHAETPVTNSESITRAMRMIDLKRSMADALKADLPELREAFKAGDVGTLVKYLNHADKHIMYASEWTLTKLEAMRRAVNHHGELRIKEAEELAAGGDRKEALKVLGEIRREYKPLGVSKRAEEVARKVRVGG